MNTITRAFRKSKASARFSVRKLSAPFRALPTCIVLGAQKAGTSSLFSYLSQHPSIHGSYKKEVHYFDSGLVPGVNTFNKGELWYRAHFPLIRSVQSPAHFLEASPSYLFVPIAAQRIQKALPNVKLIILLRNPTDRAISHYYHEVRGGYENRSPSEALRAPYPYQTADLYPDSENYHSALRYAYKPRGHYDEQIRNYLNHFDSRQIHILTSESLFTNPQAELRRVFRFLNIADEIKIPDTAPKNVNPEKKTLEQGVRQHLSRYFFPHNRSLEALIGRSMGWH